MFAKMLGMLDEIFSSVSTKILNKNVVNIDRIPH